MQQTFNASPDLSESVAIERAVYTAPKLVRLGDLRLLTLGGSLGRGDSGAPTRQSRPGGI